MLKLNSLVTALIFLFVVAHYSYAATSTGSITGRVIAEDGEPASFAALSLEKDDEVIRNATTDVDGYYIFENLEAGIYSLTVKSLTYQDQQLTGIEVREGESTKANVILVLKDNQLPPIVVKPWLGEMIDAETLVHIYRPEEIGNAPTTDIIELAATEPGVYMADNDEPIQIRGARSGSTVYYVDGLPMHDVPHVPVRAVRKMQVLTGGIPAKYGDTTGGVVVIELKNPKMF